MTGEIIFPENSFFIVGILYFFAVNLIAFYLYYADKKRAQKGKWRISEKTLIIFGFIGGAVGALCGMKKFRHKTKHWYFWLLNIIALIFHIGLIIGTIYAKIKYY